MPLVEQHGGGEQIDDCLDAFADTERRLYDIPWGSLDPNAEPTNLGDYMPQLLATALDLRIVLIKEGAPMIAGVRDASNQLVTDATREIVVVQGVRRNHWDAALPLATAPASADAAAPASPLPSRVATPLPPPVDDNADGAAGSIAAASSLAAPPMPPPSLSTMEPLVTAAAAAPSHPPTPCSGDAVSEGEAELRTSNSARRRIFADPPQTSLEEALTEQLARERGQHALQCEATQGATRSRGAAAARTA